MQTEIENVRATAELLHNQAAIDDALDTMATQINQLLAGRDPLVLCVMNGGLITAGHLLTRLTIPLTIDAINASRYQNKTVGEDIEWLIKPRVSLKDRTILIIDDILDADNQDEIYEYFTEAETDDLDQAVADFDGDYTEEELRLMRIKFMSEMAN